MTTRDVVVQGRVAEGFEAVAEEFGRNLRDYGELGAAFAAVHRGETVVDLWGGVADEETGERWREETLGLVFSGTKGFVAVAVLILVERGLLELDEEVGRYWPGFTEGVQVRHVVSHTAGLPGLRGGFTVDDLLDGEGMAARVALEPPYWAPGTRLAYHALTFGWICDGLIRRVAGRSAGRFLAEEVAGPIGLDLWIGLLPELEPRVARLRRAEDFGITALGGEEEALLRTVYGGVLDAFPWNQPAFHQAEIPGVNAIGDARSIAEFYARLDRLLSPQTAVLGGAELSRGVCPITGRPYAYGVGFELQTELERFGPPANAYGHTGSGGSTHGAWPDERVGFSYMTNDLRREAGDHRSQRLLSALHEAVVAHA
jgi:CubicO group peptidase (beta-lactamase class C family)